MIVRVDEQVAMVVEISYDVEIPGVNPEAEMDDIEEYLDREQHEIHRETVRVHREITNVEEVSE